jgi:hypothetical protein
MKKLNQILKKANITPFERVIALVQNDAHREKTGKDILSGSEMYMLTEGWSAETKEVNEYNRYINLVRLEGSMRMDARTFSHLAELTLLRNQRLLAYFISDFDKKKEVRIAEMVRGITKEESVLFTKKHTYLDYHDALHSFTFNNLPKEAQDDFILSKGNACYCGARKS